MPRWVWRNPGYLVERFLPEREGDLYCLRGWMFLGSRGYGWRLFSHDPMVKTGTMVDHEFLDDVPPEVIRARDRCKVDFDRLERDVAPLSGMIPRLAKPGTSLARSPIRRMSQPRARSMP